MSMAPIELVALHYVGFIWMVVLAYYLSNR